MKERVNVLTSIGIIIYVVTSIVDRFIVEIADYIYIPVLIIAILLMIISAVKNRKLNS